MIWNIDPVLFSLGPLKVHYYGVIYMSGFLLTYSFLLYLVRNKYLDLQKEEVENFIFYAVMWIVAGSRLFEVLFYSGSYFLKHPLHIFAVWEGGLSFHGGLLGAVLYCIYFSRKNNLKTLMFLDYCSIPSAFALFLGRGANFINGELYGLPVENQVNPPFYAVKFVLTDPLQLYRVPTQLFESMSNLFLFIFLFIFWYFYFKKRNKTPNGFLGSFFLIIYGSLRFIVEFWKDYERDALWGLTEGQLFCLPMILIGLVFLISIWKSNKKKNLTDRLV